MPNSDKNDGANSYDVNTSPNGDRNAYPRWIQPDPNVGAVLVRSRKEEDEHISKLQANIKAGNDQREKEEADAKKAADDQTIANANAIKAERRG